MKLWPGEDPPPEKDGFVIGLIVGLMIVALIIVVLTWGV